MSRDFCHVEQDRNHHIYDPEGDALGGEDEVGTTDEEDSGLSVHLVAKRALVYARSNPLRIINNFTNRGTRQPEALALRSLARDNQKAG
jgi:hypothetical protein